MTSHRWLEIAALVVIGGICLCGGIALDHLDDAAPSPARTVQVVLVIFGVLSGTIWILRQVELRRQRKNGG